jgi:hypothetical protein
MTSVLSGCRFYAPIDAWVAGRRFGERSSQSRRLHCRNREAIGSCGRFASCGSLRTERINIRNFHRDKRGVPGIQICVTSNDRSRCDQQLIPHHKPVMMHAHGQRCCRGACVKRLPPMLGTSTATTLTAMLDVARWAFSALARSAD